MNWLLISLVVIQIVAVYFWGVEPARRSLEALDPETTGDIAKTAAPALRA